MSTLRQEIRSGGLRLRSLDALTCSDESISIRFPDDQISLADVSDSFEGLDLGDLLGALLYDADSAQGLKAASLTFAGVGADGVDASLVLASHDFEAKRRTIKIADREAVEIPSALGPHLLGISAEQFSEQVLIDGLSESCGPGEAALQEAMREHFGFHDDPIETLARLESERENLESRLEAVQDELARVIRSEAPEMPAPNDPTALPDLLDALTDAREVDARLIRRRLHLLDDLNEKLSPLHQESRVSVPAILEEIEKLSARLQEVESRRTAIRGKLRNRGDDFAICAVGVAAGSAGFALCGFGVWWFNQALATFGLWISVISVGFAVFALAARWLRYWNQAKKLTKIQASGRELREDGLKLIARVGAPADLDEITAENLRRVVDRVASREARRECENWLQPHRDDPRERKSLQLLLNHLEKPISADALAEREGVPVVPLIRATKAALMVAQQWTNAIAEDRTRQSEVLEESVQRDLDLDVLQQTEEKLKAAILKVEQKIVTAEYAVNEPPTQKVAERIRKEILPFISKVLQDRAPSSIDDELCPSFKASPNSTTNRCIMNLLRLKWNGAAQEVGAFGRIYLDPGARLNEADERRLFRLFADDPTLGPLTVSFRRKRDRRGFLAATRSLAGWLGAAESVHATENEDAADVDISQLERLELAEPAALMSRIKMIDELAPTR